MLGHSFHRRLLFSNNLQNSFHLRSFRQTFLWHHYYEKNDLTQEAIKLVTTLLSKDPDFLQGYFYLQQLYENEHNHADAIEIGKEGLRLSGTSH